MTDPQETITFDQTTDISKTVTFDYMYMEYHDRMANYCRHMIKQSDEPAIIEIVGNAFLALYKKWDTIEVHTEIVLYAWLKTTVFHQTTHYFRKAKYRPPILSIDQIMEDIGDIPEFGYEDGNLCIDPYAKNQLKKMIEKLNTDDQIILHYVNKKIPIPQIAKALGLNENTVKSRWQRLRKRLQKECMKYLGEIK